MTAIRVLLVEDNAGDARLLQEYLRESAPDVSLERVETLAAGLARLSMLDIEAVILDLSLPDASGLPALVRIKEHFPTTPIVIVTGLKDEATALRAMRQGAQDYLVKGHMDGPTIVRALRFAIERMRAVGPAPAGPGSAASELRAHLDLVKAEHAALDRLLAHHQAPPHPPAPPAAAPGVTLQKRYALRSLLGRGSYGQAFLAHDEMLARQVVVKVLNDAFLPESEAERQFVKEARLLASLEHPRVIRVYDFGFNGPLPYYVMEYAEGGSLAQLLQRGALPLGQALQLVEDVLQGLEYVHSQGVLHRDLKPANILLNGRQEAKIGDFGLALLNAAPDATSANLAGAGAGTPAYAAPETLHAEPLTPASDIYAVGAILFELIAGQAHVKVAKDGGASIKAAIERTIGQGSQTDRVARVVRSMIERRPERRPQSAAAATIAVRALLE